MNTPFSDELISAYLDGELTAEQHAFVEKQLSEDPQLRRLCDELHALRSALQSVPPVDPPGDFAQRVLRQAERRMLAESDGQGEVSDGARPVPLKGSPATQLRMAHRRWPAVAGWIAAAAALLLVAGLLVGPSRWLTSRATVARRSEDAGGGEQAAATDAAVDESESHESAAGIAPSPAAEPADSSSANAGFGVGAMGPETPAAGENQKGDYSYSKQSGAGGAVRSSKLSMDLSRGSAEGEIAAEQNNGQGGRNVASGGAGYGSNKMGSSVVSPGNRRGGISVETESGTRSAPGHDALQPGASAGGDAPVAGTQLATDKLMRQLDQNRQLLVQVTMPRAAIDQFSSYANASQPTDAFWKKFESRVLEKLQTARVSDKDTVGDRQVTQGENLLVVEGSPGEVRRSLVQLVSQGGLQVRASALNDTLDPEKWNSVDTLAESTRSESDVEMAEDGVASAQARPQPGSGATLEVIRSGQRGVAGRGEGGYDAKSASKSAGPAGAKTEGKPPGSSRQPEAQLGRFRRTEAGEDGAYKPARPKIVLGDSDAATEVAKSNEKALSRESTVRPPTLKAGAQPESEAEGLQEEQDNRQLPAESRAQRMQLGQQTMPQDPVVVRILFRFKTPSITAPAQESPDK